MWRFVHLSDPHLGSMVDGEWNNRFLCTMMPDVMSCLRRDLARLKPDFLLVTGDIASHHSRDAVFAARDFIDAIGIPYYPMGGNHDFISEQSRSWFLEAFQAHLPNLDTVYSFTHRDLHVCVLDAWWKWEDDSLAPCRESSMTGSIDMLTLAARWAIPPHELAWLEEDLRANASLPTIVAVHYPAIPIPDRLRRPGIKDAGALNNGPMLLELLQNHPQVKAIFSGHTHMHYIAHHGPITQIVTGSLPEFPTEYRDVRVYSDRLEIHTCALSDTSFAARSLIPGKDWTAGEEQDRRATIPIA